MVMSVVIIMVVMRSSVIVAFMIIMLHDCIVVSAVVMVMGTMFEQAKTPGQGDAQDQRSRESDAVVVMELQFGQQIT